MRFVDFRQNLLSAIERRVRANQPVQLTLMAFPFKVPNPAKVGSRRLPDLAELAALVRIHQLNTKIKSIEDLAAGHHFQASSSVEPLPQFCT